MFKTEQEVFGAGDFGNDYIERNQGDELLASNLHFFGAALRHTRDIKSCIEFGANVGMNLKALELLHPAIDTHAIEINARAAERLREVVLPSQVHHTSILDFKVTRQWDLTIAKGVLIHINPEELPHVYDKLHAACGRYLLIAEYYNPTPIAVSYRGYSERLFKRDFAGEIMESYSQFSLLDYGFVYHRDTKFPQDDITWFLMEKR